MPRRGPRHDDATFLAALDRLAAKLRSRHPGIRVERIRAEDNPSGDDWIWYFRHPGSDAAAQVEPDWDALFLVSTDVPGAVNAVQAHSAAEAAKSVEQRLGLRSARAGG